LKNVGVDINAAPAHCLRVVSPVVV
jgi:hypothetical protein